MGAEFDNSRRTTVVGQKPDGYLGGNFDIYGHKVVYIGEVREGEEVPTYVVYEPRKKPSWILNVLEQPTMGD